VTTWAGVACALVVAACDRGPAIDSCADSLAGVWRDAEGRDWAIVDDGPGLAIYPSFADAELPPGAPAELEVAPRVIDLRRAGDQLTGILHRRFMRGATACDPAIPVRVASCGRTLELELTEPPAPTGFAPCTFPPSPPPTRVRWTWHAELRAR
jgi:hypothetical protein